MRISFAVKMNASADMNESQCGVQNKPEHAYKSIPLVTKKHVSHCYYQISQFYSELSHNYLIMSWIKADWELSCYMRGHNLNGQCTENRENHYSPWSYFTKK